MNEKQRITGHISALTTIFIWGTTFISTKVLLRSFNPIEILFFRFLIGFAALILVYPKRMPKCSGKQELMFAAAGLSGVTLYFLFENIALTYSTASNIGVIVSIAPFFTALLAGIFLDGEKPGPNFFIGFVAAITGISLISFSGSVILKMNPLGDLLALGAAILWAVYSILMKKISAYKLHTIQVTRRIFGYGLLFMLPALLFFDISLEPARFLVPVNGLNILFLGFGASALCFVTWNFAVKILGAVKTSVYIYMVPVVTVAASVLILKEKITWVSGAGVLLILFGLTLSEWRGSTKKKHADIRP